VPFRFGSATNIRAVGGRRTDHLDKSNRKDIPTAAGRGRWRGSAMGRAKARARG
jgi:hypothetical protein